MDSNELDALQNEVAQLAHLLFHQQTQGLQHNAIPNRSAAEATTEDGKAESLATVLETAEKQIKQNNLRRILCGYLSSASGDLTEISKIVAAVLLPLSVTSKIPLQSDPLIYAGIALVVFNANVKVFCGSPDDGDKK